jgi:hypothetical protein
VTDRTEGGKGRPASYRSRLVESVQLWSEARRAAAYDDAIFIWIPKNAGSSVHAILRGQGFVKLKSPRAVRLSFRNRGRVTFGHIAIGSLVQAGFVSRQYVERAFKFAVTRDPYARAISLYRYLSSPKPDVLPNWHNPPDFRAFLRLLADGHYDRIGLYNSRGLSQCSPQSDWLRDAQADKLFRSEELGELLADIRDRWGIAAREVPHLNRSAKGTALDLDREDKALIDKIYAEDFEMLGYSKRRLHTSGAGN